MPKAIFKRWAGPGIVALLGFGVDMIPGNNSWIPSIIIWALALIWFGWYAWPSITKRLPVRKWRYSKMIIGGGIALIVIGLIMITTQLDFSKESKTEATIETKPSDEESTPSLEKKSEIQMELDTLISNIAEFVSNEPPAPTQIQGEDWASWQQRYSEHRDKIQSDFFNSFNTRIAGVVEKLHNLKIISADEYESVKTHYNHASTIYAARATSLIEKLNIYKARLDEMEKTFTSK